MIKEYNKLVRDKIPDIIRNRGGECETRTLSCSEFLKALHKKLDEEVAEFHESSSPEELADIMEVIHAFAIFNFGLTGWHDLMKIKDTKAENRGSFSKKILLINTSEEENKNA